MIDAYSLDRRLSGIACAVHEAGHAVAMFINQASPEGAWISRNKAGRWEGEVERRARSLWHAIANPVPWVDPKDAEWEAEHNRSWATREAAIKLAGPIAEVRWRNRSRIAAQLLAGSYAKICFCADHDDGSDMGDARRYLEWLHPEKEREQAFVRLWLETEEALARQWAAVVAIGRALRDASRLSDERIYRLWNDLRRD